MRSVAAVDLFCGIGGLTHGLIEAGIPVIAGIDVDRSCKHAFEANNKSKFIHKSIGELNASQLEELYPRNCTRVLVACAPCQPFSRHTQKYKRRDEDEKWGLLHSFGELIGSVQPEIVSMENVPEIAETNVFADFVFLLNSLDYHVFWDKVSCAGYGVPQSRKRLVLLASKLGEIEIIKASYSRDEYRTVSDAIGELEAIEAGAVSTHDPLHCASRLSDINLRRIKQSKPGGTWMDWQEELRAPCHRKESGKTYIGVYSRMSWGNLAPTITTQFYSYGTGRFGHPEQHRALSLREGALLQTFPLDYDFIDPEVPLSFKCVGRQIGNAVPVRLGYAIGRSITAHLDCVQGLGG